MPRSARATPRPEDDNVTHAKLVRLLVDDQPFDVRSGELRAHERSLDFHSGFLERRVEWVSPCGRGVRVRSARLVSLVQRSMAAVAYEVEPLDAPLRVVVQSELIASAVVPSAGGDPRASAVLAAPLRSESHECGDAGAALPHTTAGSGLRVAVADAGAQTIHYHLTKRHATVPSQSTIWRVLRARGFVTEQPHKRPRSSYRRFVADLLTSAGRPTSPTSCSATKRCSRS
jgi:trehalose/maltose hydrolase-like predicted phosphorylase